MKQAARATVGVSLAGEWPPGRVSAAGSGLWSLGDDGAGAKLLLSLFRCGSRLDLSLCGVPVTRPAPITPFG